MMPDENIGLLEAARAIVAGRPVDWVAIESSADLTDSSAGLLRQLKILEGIAALHRSLPDPSQASDPGVASRDSAPVAAVAAPQRWGPLQLLEQVGQGSFGDVYRAWDPRLDREVALKLLKRADKQDTVGALVVDEARLLARVRHPNVVTVYGADRIDGRVGLWMEFVSGRTIEAVLRDHGPLGAREAALIGLDVCRALSAVHRAGVIHRDIKAQNVVREAGGRIVLMDFGTGRENFEEASAELAGTPLYLAPEVFAGDPATTRSDIYSAGVLLYHLVTASYPVKGRTAADLRDAHARRDRTWLRDDRPDLADAFVQAVERALEGDPDRRYESAGEMEAALTRVVSTSDPALSATSTATANSSLSVGKPLRPWLRRAPALVAAASVATIVAAALALTPLRERLGMRRSPPPSNAGAAASAAPVAVRRQVQLPDYSFIGSPSPDGRLFSLSDETGNVAVVDLMSGHARRVTDEASSSARASQFADATTISPDRQTVAYGWNALDGQYELRLVDLEGKHPLVLLRNESIERVSPIHWSHDGKSILVVLRRSDRSIQLALVSVDDGAVHVVSSLRMEPQYASLSPDGEFVVYDAPQRKADGARDIFIVRADGSDARGLVEHPANDTDPVWAPDGRHVVFASDRSGTMDLWSLAVDAGVAHGEPQLVHRNIGRMLLRGMTDKGQYFYYQTVGTVDVYEATLTNGTVTSVAALSTTYSGSNISSIFSPDGRWFAYASRRGLAWFDRGSTTLVVRNIDTHEERELAPAMTGFLVRSWSPDGQYVLVQGGGVDGHRGAYEIDTTDGRAAPVVVDAESARPDWLSDGRILYFSRSKHQLLARDLRSRADEVIFDCRAAGIEPAADISGRGYKLSPDGQTLALTVDRGEGDRSTHSLIVKVLPDGPSRELLRVHGSEGIRFQDWMPDGSAVVFTRANASELASLWQQSIDGGDPRPLGLAKVGLRDVSVHPSGTKITFTAGWPVNELWLVEHFLPEK